MVETPAKTDDREVMLSTSLVLPPWLVAVHVAWIQIVGATMIGRPP